MYKLKKQNRVFVLTGAGISKASGIYTYRDDDGAWRSFDPDKVSTPKGVQENKTLSWQFFQAVSNNLKNKDPNSAHNSLVKLQQYVNSGNFVLVTQNIDGLHQKAGSKNVLEMHGNYKKMICNSPRCFNVSYQINEVINSYEYKLCPHCGNMLRPSVVMFGETPMHMSIIKDQLSLLKNGDLFLSIGTSGLVRPACSFPMMAWANGAYVFNINYDIKKKNYQQERYWWIFDQKAEEYLPSFIDSILL